MNRHISYPSVSRYSKKHKYDKFSAMTGTKRPVELFDVVMPDYVNITYEVIIWTDFTEHMNKIVEAFQYATDEYWGDKEGFKFRVKIDNFDNTTTRGTKQDVDGMLSDHFLIAKRLMIDVIKRLVQLADLHVMYTPGNHDHLTGWMVAQLLEVHFRNNKNISFDVSLQMRKYYKYYC